MSNGLVGLITVWTLLNYFYHLYIWYDSLINTIGYEGGNDISVSLLCSLIVLIYSVEFSKFSLITDFQVRHRLKRDYGIEGGIPVVFSLEKPKVKLLPFKGPSGEEENPSDYQVNISLFVWNIRFESLV